MIELKGVELRLPGRVGQRIEATQSLDHQDLVLPPRSAPASCEGLKSVFMLVELCAFVPGRRKINHQQGARKEMEAGSCFESAPLLLPPINDIIFSCYKNLQK